MAKLSVKYKCGDKVACGDVVGKVTAVTARGKGRTYEFSYIDRSGNPTSCAVEECELSHIAEKPLGFRAYNE